MIYLIEHEFDNPISTEFKLNNFYQAIITKDNYFSFSPNDYTGYNYIHNSIELLILRKRSNFIIFKIDKTEDPFGTQKLCAMRYPFH